MSMVDVEVDSDEVLSQLDIDEVVDHYGAEAILDEIGKEKAIEHFEIKEEGVENGGN